MCVCVICLNIIVKFFLYNCLNILFCDLEVLTKENIVEPMRDIRRALLEADVSFFNEI